ncbi:MAG: hypothetical protein ACKN9W_13660 [Methylococcus sp.]
MTQFKHLGWFDDLELKQTLTPEEEARHAVLQAYDERFGYLPFGVGYPELTNEQLWEAVRTGQEITENTPEGAVS